MYFISGNIIYDFFMGHELNPRIGPLDLKVFCELRPGLIGWMMLNLAFLYEAFEKTGTFPPNLTLAVFFQFIYVADCMWFEVCKLFFARPYILYGKRIRFSLCVCVSSDSCPMIDLCC